MILKKRKSKLFEDKKENLFLLQDGVDFDPRDLPPYELYWPTSYTDGPEGFISWCDDDVRIPIYPVGSVMAVWWPLGDLPKDKHPKTGKSYKIMWEEQKDLIRQGLRMVNSVFIYRLIVLCWMRGEGKSLLACLIQLWKFMNWSKQNIVLGANSKDQVTFVHFDIIKDVILNSPNLLRNIGGKRNILEKKLRMLDTNGNVASTVRAISSFSGIVSNITGYTFSEIFDMKNPRFFVQLDGSIRNIPNALGVIDSTVSAKNHILYQLYKSYQDQESKSVFFNYRFSKKGLAEDYWNPNMDQSQLDDYRSKFPFGEFARYFLNTWGSSAESVFEPEAISAFHYLGVDGLIGNNSELFKTLKRKNEIQESLNFSKEKSSSVVVQREIFLQKSELGAIKQRLIPVENRYSLRDSNGYPQMATLQDLQILGNLLDTKWAILCGLDRADPLKTTNHGARTIFTCVAKGLPGSASRPFLLDEGHVPNYIYFLLHLVNVEDHSLESLKELILTCKGEFDSIERLCGERWGMWDLVPWCEEQEIPFEAIFPSYDKQRATFSELYLVINSGRFKTSPIGVMGSKEADILMEEANVFYHDSDKHWFGSPEKGEAKGIQDDSMYSLGYAIYGGREINANDFRERRGDYWFGTMVQEQTHLGNY